IDMATKREASRFIPHALLTRRAPRRPASSTLGTLKIRWSRHPPSGMRSHRLRLLGFLPALGALQPIFYVDVILGDVLPSLPWVIFMFSTLSWLIQSPRCSSRPLCDQPSNKKATGALAASGLLFGASITPVSRDRTIRPPLCERAHLQPSSDR